MTRSSKKATTKKSVSKISSKKAATKHTTNKKNTVVSSSEKDWRAQSDAQTLKSAREISSDTTRLKAAQAVLKKDIAAAQQVLKGGASK